MKYFSTVLALVILVWAGMIAFGHAEPLTLFQVLTWGTGLLVSFGLLVIYGSSTAKFLEGAEDKSIRDIYQTMTEPGIGLHGIISRLIKLIIVLFCFIIGYHWLAALWAVNWVASYLLQPVVEKVVAEEYRRRFSE